MIVDIRAGSVENWGRAMRLPAGIVKALAIVSALVFCAGLLAHVSSFSANPVISMSQVWPIHLAIFVPFGGMVLVLASYRNKPDPSQANGWLNRIGSTNQPNPDFHRQLLRLCPWWVLVVSVVLFAYAFVNFHRFFDLIKGGSPVEENGQYVLRDHARFVRPLTASEYQQLRAYEVRGFSGHWMLFAFLPFVYFAFIEPRQRELEAAAQQPLDSDRET